MQSIKISDLTKFIASEIETGRLSNDSEVRLHAGWEGDERLDARVTVEAGEDGVAYLLVSQAK